ncbi:MAG TPA: PRC-barrel domain-containing protein, partial [Chloroflexia bacterium]|nr:PRC-barrel domain-containing protein [Chloroflexia bacterium]
MEKKAKQIIGMPVVTFDRGTKIYDVEDMILDPQRRQVLALVVMEGSLFHSARAIPFGRISAIGQDAVIVPDGKAVIDVNRDPVLKKLDNDQVVRGLRVLTDDGRRLGYIEDITLDDKTGEILSYDVSIGRVFNVTQGARTLPADIVINTGSRVMYVPAAYGRQFDEQVGGWAGALDAAGDRIKTAGAKANAGLEELGGKAIQATSELKVGERAGEFALGKEAH